MLPRDQQKWYNYLEHVKQGLKMPIVLLTYSHDSNLGNHPWIWHTSATDINSTLQTCQPLIERIRTTIPVSHLCNETGSLWKVPSSITIHQEGCSSVHVQRLSWRCVRCCYHQSRSLDLHCFSFFQHSFINDPIANKIRPFKSLIILELVLTCSFYLQQIWLWTSLGWTW